MSREGEDIVFKTAPIRLYFRGTTGEVGVWIVSTSRMMLWTVKNVDGRSQKGEYHDNSHSHYHHRPELSLVELGCRGTRLRRGGELKPAKNHVTFKSWRSSSLPTLTFEIPHTRFRQLLNLVAHHSLNLPFDKSIFDFPVDNHLLCQSPCRTPSSPVPTRLSSLPTMALISLYEERSGSETFASY